MNKTNIAIHGAAGRLGLRLTALGHENPTLMIGCAIDASENRVMFGMLGESLEFTVKTSNQDCYAFESLSAAKFVGQSSPGLSSMNDVNWPKCREK